MFRSSCLAALAAVCCASSANAQDVVAGLSTDTRIAVDRDGVVGNVIANNLSMEYSSGDYEGNTDAPTSVQRANGSTDWGYQLEGNWTAFGPQNTYIPFGNDPIDGLPPGDYGDPVSFAEATTWMDSNMRGAWQMDWASGSTFNFDTTSDYISPSDLTLPELTAASRQQFYDIRDQGLTGTFTFQMTYALPENTQDRFQFHLANFQTGNAQSGSVASGDSFTVDILEPLGFNSTLQTTYKAFSFGENVGSFGENITLSTTLSAVYGRDYSTPAVPGVGGVAALAGLGLIGRRRRR